MFIYIKSVDVIMPFVYCYHI